MPAKAAAHFARQLLPALLTAKTPYGDFPAMGTQRNRSRMSCYQPRPAPIELELPRQSPFPDFQQNPVAVKRQPLEIFCTPPYPPDGRTQGDDLDAGERNNQPGTCKRCGHEDRKHGQRPENQMQQAPVQGTAMAPEIRELSAVSCQTRIAMCHRPPAAPSARRLRGATGSRARGRAPARCRRPGWDQWSRRAPTA